MNETIISPVAESLQSVIDCQAIEIELLSAKNRLDISSLIAANHRAYLFEGKCAILRHENNQLRKNNEKLTEKLRKLRLANQIQ